MTTHVERAGRLWARYGRRSGDAFYLAGEYVGKVNADGSTSRAVGMSRGLVIPGVDPVQVVARWLTSVTKES